MRGSPAVVVIRPKVFALKFRLGLPQLKVFNRLNASTRSSRFCVDPSDTSLDTARSIFQNPGPLMLVRAERAVGRLRERGSIQVAREALEPLSRTRQLSSFQRVVWDTGAHHEARVTIPRSDITEQQLYMNRRAFVRAATAAAVTAAMGRTESLLAAGRPAVHGRTLANVRTSRFSTNESSTPWDDITSYNNFYEFAGSDNKDLPSQLAPENLITSPWTITVDGECAKTGTYSIEQVLAGRTLEERIYRHRCVEGWSMVIPWIGFPLADFIKTCQPTAKAAYVAFDSHYDSAQMPLSRRLPFDWPYTEGLRMDEATHPLTILAVGLYGEPLPHQDGAPIRLVVPWKYGFKSLKSIVRISFVADQPLGTYEKVDPDSYGFYSNVNPTVDHPRWSQATERRIGEFRRRKTLMFNGYGREVGALYAGMNLQRNW